jgi:putative DNA primase/helicase
VAEKRAKSYSRVELKKLFEVPEELRNTNQWLVWKLINKGKEKPAKVPHDAKTGQPADPTNPASWCSCVVAVNAFGINPFYTGVGFAFTEADPYTGIDIDDCRDKETGELGTWAKEIIAMLDSYTEVTPSGTGIHIIVKGKAPGQRQRTSKIEMYSQKRYFTITGERIGECNTVEDRQEQIERLYQLVFEEVPELPQTQAKPRDDLKLERVRAITDEKLIVRASRKENFKYLWDGSTAAYADDASRATAALLMMLAYWTRADAARMDKLFRQSGLMRKKWDDKRKATTWGAEQIEHAIAKQLTFYDPELDETPTNVHNDTSNADLFVALADGEFCWLDTWQMWLKWNGIYWTREAGTEVREATRRVMNEVWRRATALGPDNLKKAEKQIAWAIKCGDAWKRQAMEKLSRDMLSIPAEQFDKEPFLLACSNGVIDLTTGELRTGRREDRLTRGLTLEYDCKAACPQFDNFLDEIMLGDEKMIEYLWRVIGYALTGDTSERAFFVFHGRGRNGKSTLVEALMSLLGHYAQSAKFDTFLHRKEPRSGANDDIAHLVGARCVIAQEAEEGKALDAALIKVLTGQDTIRARFLYSKEFQFRPAFKLFLVTNHVPKINEAAHALWQRIHYVRFEYDIPEEKVDPRLAYKLGAEMKGIFARAVRGALEWRKEGLAPPARVVKSGNELREEMDPIRPFIEAKCGFAEGAELRQSEIYSAYQKWCKDSGIRYPVSSRSLGDHLANQRFESFKGNGNAKMWRGIELKF